MDFIGGFSALVQKGMTDGDRNFLLSIPEALDRTQLVCSSVNVATTRAGINMDAVALMGRMVKETAQRTADRDGIGAAKLVVFANAVEDNPFMAGAFHGMGEGECVVSVGVSGPGVVSAAISDMKGEPFDKIAETIKKTAFNITRMGELVAREASRRLGVEFGIVDLSLAPTPAQGDSVAHILEAMGLERTGTHGTTAALALLNDAVKKGGIMASSHVGGLSGAFIPVSEDAGMIDAARAGALHLDKLEAMTCVCSVGLDMIDPHKRSQAASRLSAHYHINGCRFNGERIACRVRRRHLEGELRILFHFLLNGNLPGSARHGGQAVDIAQRRFGNHHIGEYLRPVVCQGQLKGHFSGILKLGFIFGYFESEHLTVIRRRGCRRYFQLYRIGRKAIFFSLRILCRHLEFQARALRYRRRILPARALACRQAFALQRDGFSIRSRELEILEVHTPSIFDSDVNGNLRARLHGGRLSHCRHFQFRLRHLHVNGRHIFGICLSRRRIF